mgnify:CR=1 FL=1
MEIRISRCATRCHACEHDFVHEQKVHSVARMEQETLVRLDYCAECRPRDKDGALFCSWETRYNDPKILEAEQQETLSPLRRLFYDLADSSVRIDLAQAFLAAQLLKRQRAFRQIRESEDSEGDTRTTLYLDRSGNRLIETRDLNFSYAELDEARIALVERLRVLESPEVQPDLELDSSLSSSEDDLTASQQTLAPNEEEATP